MKQISTAESKESTTENITESIGSTGLKPGAFFFPKDQTVRNILAYSRALKVVDSELIGKISLISN